MTPSEVFEFAKKHGARMLDLKFVDMLGTCAGGSYIQRAKAQPPPVPAGLRYTGT